MELLVKETCNAAVTAARRGTIRNAAFDRVVEAALRLSSKNVKMFPQGGLIENSVRLAYENKLTVYDSLYLSLAEVLKAPLISLDLRQAEVARRMKLVVLR